MKRACIVGWPVKHSRSPMIHRYWLRRLGLAGDYVQEGVPPEDFARFLKSLGDRGYVGCNVTLPHKEAAFALLDEVDPAAAALGAANTIWLDDGRLCGSNSDVMGFLASLDADVPGWAEEAGHALVLGAGGAARGIVHGLISRGVAKITVANRSTERAEAIAAEFGPRVAAAALTSAPSLLPGIDLLINTTALGMAGQPPLDLALDGLKTSAIVADIVYVPLETPLIAVARARGHRVVGGLGMLLYQAIPGFSKWFGTTPVVTPELYELVAADVRGS
ncbi:shikimate dehydrogenase [Phreatobacter sp. AB_2022a]|uniref:shikimate dehydrogenase n=1 Tax=Phreatobacter sp. AB_2022a TaxID=3003134 RepID=UPI0022875FC6|nr:shikimate dehydrogenase [Phreatobacter sp. AB_2022a]MCZ0736055.1 shikimate dehydrogenase [Phreatobacter sp. AB_2022a]